MEISYISNGYKLSENIKGEIIKRKSLLISSNIDIEEQALDRGLTISYKDFACLFDRDILEQRKDPYKTIDGYASDKDKEIKDRHVVYNLSIFTTENKVYFYELPKGFPEDIKEKKNSDTLYCQYVIYFYMAKPIIKSNIIEIPFKDIKEIINK
ncbi:hypothetical protein HYE53_03665 [Aggregatibacter actinomycetemcomitans]|uniref:hypothetical protein n=1 Tax=Aggregatibacter actinomycetemcomitans TaxID=714 RepID=UPI00197B30C8|nr:hypothetical protein [Aggregatibacter actinomycetemcomitans]MBN6070210.1 hypothetical protein [Aggregatibacter actinomycetemcomitans]